MNFYLFINLILFSILSYGKEIALSFDDAPVTSSKHYESRARSHELIRKLKELNVPPVMIFANPCKGDSVPQTIQQIKMYRDANHLIGNHTCSHPRLDEVGSSAFIRDAEDGDRLLDSLFYGQRYLRFPYLNEGKVLSERDKVREWMKTKGYRNGLVSIDNDDYVFSQKINQAKNLGKKIDYKKVEKMFLDHLIGAANFYENLAIKTLGRSPKHVILLHEVDATVMFIDTLVNELRKQGWTIISIEDAYKDKMYSEQPPNIYANNGIIAQLAFEKTGKHEAYTQYDTLKAELEKLLGISK